MASPPPSPAPSPSPTSVPVLLPHLRIFGGGGMLGRQVGWSWTLTKGLPFRDSPTSSKMAKSLFQECCSFASVLDPA